MIEVRVVEAPINREALFEFVEDNGHGAQCSFFGTVRDFNLGQEVSGVSYDLYEPMVKSSFSEIAEEAKAKYCTEAKIAIVHRYGRLGIREASVGIVVSTPHRDESFQICRYVIEELKVRAPIWKKEHYLTGDSEWLKGHELCQKSHGAHGHSAH